MPTSRITFAVCSALLLSISTTLAQWVNIGTGIDYQEFTTADPNNVFVTRMVVSDPDCVIGTMIGQNRVSGGAETVSAQASRRQDALNCWGQSWGQRNNVVVAINGSFFNGTSGVITGEQIFDGWYAKQFDDWSGQTGFVWKYDRSYFIGVCPHYRANEQTVTLGGASRAFDGINVSRGANQLILYTPQYDNNTLTDGSGVEVLVALSRPLMAPPRTPVTGTIEQVRVEPGVHEHPL